MSNQQKKSKPVPRKEISVGEKPVMPPGLPDRWVEGLLLVALIGLPLLLFAESFSADFTFDDFTFVVENPQIHNWEFELDPWYRWRKHVRALTFMVDYSLFRDSPTGYHVHNFIWHVVSVVLFYVLVRVLSNRASIAFFAALLFTTHPIHVEAITNITNRKELLCMAFLLASCISYMEFTRRVGPQRVAWFIAAVVAWIFALFSKHVAITLPLYLIAYEYVFVPQEKRFLFKNPLVIGGGFSLGISLMIAYVLIRAVNLEDLHDSITFKGYAGEATLFSVAITSARMFWRYVGLLIWPDDLCPDHLETLSQSLLEPMTLLSWGSLIAVVAVAFLLARRSPLLSFGTFWFLISFLPISNLIPTSYLLADRYMYIPSAGFCIVLVCLGDAMYQKLHGFKPPFAIPVMAVVGGLLIVGYSQKVLSYNTYWKNERVLWQYVLECNPESFRAYGNLGYQYLRAGSYPKAIELLSKAINLGFEKSYEHRGSAYIGMENYEAAMQDFNHALAYDPDWDTAYYGRGLVYFKRGQYERAIDDFSRAIELKPDYSEAYNNRGLAYENLDRRDEALKDYFEATKLDPDNGAAHNNLGRALVYAGRLKEAIQSFQRAEKLGVAQATKILEILNKQGLPSDQGTIDPSRSQPVNKEVEKLESGMSSD